MISSENAQLRSIVFLNVRGRDMGSFVTDAREALRKELKLPAGYTAQWSGQWENQIRAKQRLELMMPIVFVIIFLFMKSRALKKGKLDVSCMAGWMKEG